MKTRYHGLLIQEIVQQLSIDQFTRLSSMIDSDHGKGTYFDILSVKPYRNSKDESMIAISVLLPTKRVKVFDIAEKI